MQWSPNDYKTFYKTLFSFKDLKAHVKMIADFLQLKPSEELIEEIANKCEFQTMSKFKNSNIPEDMHMVTDVKSNHIIYWKGNTLENIDHLPQVQAGLQILHIQRPI